MSEKHIMAKNNPTDMDAYREYMRQERLELQKLEKEKEIKRLKKNLEDWTESLDWPWNQADLRFFQGRPVEIVNEELKHGKLRSFVMLGGANRGKTFLTYAVVKRFLQMGLVTPSQIRRTTVREAASNINGMFQSREWKDNFFSKDAKLLIVEGASREQSQLSDKSIERFWRELNDFCKQTEAKVIITYLTDEEETNKINILPVLTIDNKFNLKFLQTMKFLEITDNTRNPNAKLKGR